MAIIASSPFVSSLEHIIGFFVVLFALTLLWILTAVIGKLFIRAEARAAASGAGNNPSTEEVAAITACVATLMGPGTRIVSIQRDKSEN